MMADVKCDTAKECGHDCRHAKEHVAFANCDQRNYCRKAEVVVICTPGGQQKRKVAK